MPVWLKALVMMILNPNFLKVLANDLLNLHDFLNTSASKISIYDDSETFSKKQKNNDIQQENE